MSRSKHNIDLIMLIIPLCNVYLKRAIYRVVFLGMEDSCEDFIVICGVSGVGKFVVKIFNLVIFCLCKCLWEF